MQNENDKFGEQLSKAPLTSETKESPVELLQNAAKADGFTPQIETGEVAFLPPRGKPNMVAKLTEGILQPLADYDPTHGWMIVKLEDIKSITKFGLTTTPKAQSEENQRMDTSKPLKVLKMPNNFDIIHESYREIKHNVGDYVFLTPYSEGLILHTSDYGRVALTTVGAVTMIVRNYDPDKE